PASRAPVSRHSSPTRRSSDLSAKDVQALAEIRARVPEANLVVDLQENYRLIAQVAPFVAKVRYNPGHLYHHEKQKSARDKVAFIDRKSTRLNSSHVKISYAVF